MYIYLKIQNKMSSNNSEILEISDNYIHIKSDVTPEWVKKLEDFKLKIRSELEKPHGSSHVGAIKFSHPIDVPNSQNK